MAGDAAQTHLNAEAYRASNSTRSRRQSQHETSSDSPSNTPPSSTSHKVKGVKPHVVGARLHTRVPSHGKALHKLARPAETHALPKPPRPPASAPTSPEIPPMKRSGSEPKLSRNGSTTSLKKNSSHVSLKRNRSHVEVKRPRSAGGLKRSTSQVGVNGSKSLQRTSVHFDLGNDGPDDGWTEASGSASPELSRPSSGRSSAKPPTSTSNSQPHSLAASPSKTREWTPSRPHDHHPTLDAHQITSRLLQRTPSLNAPPKMSSISVIATASALTPDSFMGSRATPLTDTPGTNSDELSARFVHSKSSSGISGARAAASPLRSSHTSDPKLDPGDMDSARRARSMGNLTGRADADVGSDSDEGPLAPRRGKSSRRAHAYNPPQQSRTQQKLWLQRASSNIEPQQMAPGAAINGLGLGIGMPGIRPGAPLVGAGDDGRDPRIRLQLERTGLEYLVVRRYQDPVGRAVKRLEKLPGANKHRRIPRHERKGGANGVGQRASHGLSQSLKEGRGGRGRENGTTSSSGARSSYEGAGGDGHGHGTGARAGAGLGTSSVESDRTMGGNGDTDADDDGVAALLRSMWDKNLDLNPSED